MSSLPSRAELKQNLRMLKERLDERPMDLDARMRIARTYRLLDKPADAVAHYSAVARYLSLAGHPLQAIAVLKELLQVDPKHADTLLFLAKLYARTRAADASNRGRIAVPIADGAAPTNDDDDVHALPDGLPSTATGIWRAIRPATADSLSRVRDADEVGAAIDDEDTHAGHEDDDIVDADDASVEQDDESADGGADDDDALHPPVADVPSGEHTLPSDLRTELNSADEVPDVVTGRRGPEESLLARVSLFSSLTPETLTSLTHAMVQQTARAGDVLFKAGDVGDSCIVIAQGRARAHRDVHNGTAVVDVTLAELHEAELAGLFALVGVGRRQATLTALTDVEFFEIDGAAVGELVRTHGRMKPALDALLRTRLLTHAIAQLPFFQSRTPLDRARLVDRCSDVTHAAGDAFVDEGADVDGVWLVLSGGIELRADGDAAARRVLRPGDAFALLAHSHDAPAELEAIASPGVAGTSNVPTRCAVLPQRLVTEAVQDRTAQHVAAVKAAGLSLSEHVVVVAGPAGLRVP